MLTRIELTSSGKSEIEEIRDKCAGFFNQAISTIKLQFIPPIIKII